MTCAQAAMDDGEGGMEEEQDFKEKERERRKLEMEKLKREIQGMKKGARAVKLKSGEEAVTSGGDKDSDLLTGVQQKRAVLKSKKRVGADRSVNQSWHGPRLNTIRFHTSRFGGGLPSHSLTHFRICSITVKRTRFQSLPAS